MTKPWWTAIRLGFQVSFMKWTLMFFLGLMDYDNMFGFSWRVGREWGGWSGHKIVWTSRGRTNTV